MNDTAKHFFDLIERATGQEGLTKYTSNKAFLANNKKFLHAPNFVVDNLQDLDKALEEYIEAINNAKIGFTNPLNTKGNFNDFFLFSLLRDMAVSDYENLPNYIRRRKDYVNDTTFSNLNSETHLAKLGEFALSAKRSEEPHGLETPFAMNYFFRRRSKPYKLPKVRYGVSNEQKGKTACVYCVQDGHVGSQKFGFMEKLEKQINAINTGVKKHRNCEPRMVLSLALFIKQAHEDGIRNITAPDYIPVRYGIRYDENSKKIRDEDTLNKIQSRTTESFLRLFARLQEQITGITVTAYPNDIDSYLHINLANELSTKNELLSNLCGFKMQTDLSKNKQTDFQM